MERKIWILMVLIGLFQTISCAGFFAVHAPEILRPESDYNLAISLFESDISEDFKVIIKGLSWHGEQSVTLEPYSSKTVKFKIPALSGGDYNLTVSRKFGAGIESVTESLRFKPSLYSVVIQTDRAVYKPGDLVRFRVILLDKFTRPANVSSPINIFVADATKSRIQVFSDVTLKSSVYTGEYQLSKLPTFGEWNISVFEDQMLRRVKTFSVAEYVLPNFSVKVESENDIVIDRSFKTANFTIKAYYTFGQPVLGKATLELKTVELKPKTLTRTITLTKNSPSTPIQIDLNRHLRLNSRSTATALEVTAIVEEKFTAIRQNYSGIVKIHSKEYLIRKHKQFPETFHPDVQMKIKFYITTFDGHEITDKARKVTLLAIDSNSKKELTFKAFVLKGIVEFEISLPEADSYTLKVSYLNVEETLDQLDRFQSTTDHYIALYVDSAIYNYRVGEQIGLTLRTNETITYFDYNVNARGSIIKSNVTKLTEGSKTYGFKINVTADMVPNFQVVASTILNGELRTASTRFLEVEGAYKNKIRLETVSIRNPEDEETRVRVGDFVNIKVTTKPNAFVGLLAVDQRSVLLRKGNNINTTEIMEGLRSFESGLKVLTNAKHSKQTISKEPNNVVSIDPDAYNGYVREIFPETWIWEDLLTSSNVSLTMKAVPHTITSWVLTAFALHPEDGFVFTDQEITLQVFQKFFISFNLPYSVKLGEDLTFKVLVSNYRYVPFEIEVSVDNKSNDFELLPTDYQENPQRKIVNVKAESVEYVSFKIRPKRVGDKIPIRVMAKCTEGQCGDTVENVLKVEPNGIKKFGNQELYIKLSDESRKQSKTVKLDIPENVIKNSVMAKVSAVGSIMGSTFNNLNGLVRVPSGCGEQIMINLVPNIVVMKYLKATSQLTPDIENQIKRNLEKGYQLIRNYKHYDGSFSLWGRNDCCGSTWLSSYIARTMEQASKYIYVNPDEIDKAYNFLVGKQKDNGEFQEAFRTYHTEVSSLFGRGNLALTSFVLISFLENETRASKYSSVIEKGLKYIADNIKTKDDIFIQAIAAYALALRKHSETDSLLTKLEAKAKTSGDKKWWQLSNSPSTHDVEITGYVLLALTVSETKTLNDLLPIINWLVSKRNTNGGFSSTQDTVIGLSALTQYTEMTDTDLTVDIKSNLGSPLPPLTVNGTNALITQSKDLESNARSFDVTVEGKGSCLLQFSYQYYIPSPPKNPAFDVQINSKHHNERMIEVEVCSANANKTAPPSNMAYVKIELPSGYTALHDYFDDIEKTEGVKRIETWKDDTVVIVYLESVKDSNTCVKVKAVETFGVNNIKESYVLVSDFYDTTKNAEKTYLLPAKNEL